MIQFLTLAVTADGGGEVHSITKGTNGYDFVTKWWFIAICIVVFLAMVLCAWKFKLCTVIVLRFEFGGGETVVKEEKSVENPAPRVEYEKIASPPTVKAPTPAKKPKSVPRTVTPKAKKQNIGGWQPYQAPKETTIRSKKYEPSLKGARRSAAKTRAKEEIIKPASHYPKKASGGMTVGGQKTG